MTYVCVYNIILIVIKCQRLDMQYHVLSNDILQRDRIMTMMIQRIVLVVCCDHD